MQRLGGPTVTAATEFAMQVDDPIHDRTSCRAALRRPRAAGAAPPQECTVRQLSLSSNQGQVIRCN
eukprot:766607-Hanusia_phi.AAC.6